VASTDIESLQALKQEFQKLPGIGPRSAERLAFHVLRSSRAEAGALADAILAVKDKVIHCRTCYNLTETDPCAICRDDRRDHGEVWVVEQPKDVMALEQTGLVGGVYHVLMGHIAPLDGVEPGDLTIKPLLERVQVAGVREVVLATNPTVEGDGTALYLDSVLRDRHVRVTRLARGLAVGSSLEYASLGMLQEAIRGRTAL
jgi:recombination protein RecR